MIARVSKYLRSKFKFRGSMAVPHLCMYCKIYIRGRSHNLGKEEGMPG